MNIAADLFQVTCTKSCNQDPIMAFHSTGGFEGDKKIFKSSCSSMLFLKRYASLLLMKIEKEFKVPI